MTAHSDLLWLPAEAEELEAVGEQLQRLLSSHSFRNSQRYPALLRYVVEQTVAGNAEQLKERTLGVAVFHRAPDYDTNADPVVRITAGEVRKRLAQYYQEHPNELRIDLPSGSYVPHFHPVDRGLQATAVEVLPAPIEVLDPAEGAPAATLPPRARWPRHGGSRGRLARLPRGVLWGLAGLLLLLGIGTGWLLVRQYRHPQTELDRFWSPVMGAQQAPALVIGARLALYLAADGTPLANGSPLDEGTPLAGTEAPARAPAHSGTVQVGPVAAPGERESTIAVGDALSFARVASLLSRRGSDYTASSAAQTSLEELRAHPSVLFGAFNNAWSLHATSRLPLQLGYDKPPGYSRMVWIADTRKPHGPRWQVNCQEPVSKMTMDYAVVARYFDQEVDQEVVLVAGLRESGTTAASEFVTSDRYLAQLDRFAPPGGWAGHNLEAVIATEVVGGRSGPPRVVAAYFW